MSSRDNFETKRICHFLRNHEIPDPSNYNDFYREGLEDYSDFSLEDPGVSETSSGLRTFDSSVPAIQKLSIDGEWEDEPDSETRSKKKHDPIIMGKEHKPNPHPKKSKAETENKFEDYKEYDDSNNEDPGKLDKDAEKEIKRVREYLQGDLLILKGAPPRQLIKYL
ncbi:hypothetical protein WN943_010212 [Citrus x changshan-huyou]